MTSHCPSLDARTLRADAPLNTNRCKGARTSITVALSPHNTMWCCDSHLPGASNNRGAVAVPRVGQTTSRPEFDDPPDDITVRAAPVPLEFGRML